MQTEKKIMNLYKNLQCPNCRSYHPDNFAAVTIPGYHPITAEMLDGHTTIVLHPFLCKTCGTIFVSRTQLLAMSVNYGTEHPAGQTAEITPDCQQR